MSVSISTYQELVDWLQSLPTFIDQLHRHQFTGDVTTANRLMGRSDEYLSLLMCVYRRSREIHEPQNSSSVAELSSDVLELVEVVYHFREHYQEWVLHLLDNETEDDASELLLPARVYRGTPGRPPYQVPKSQIEALMELGFSYAAMARMLHVSPRTIRRRREEYGLPIGRYYSDITDNHLDELIGSILQVYTYTHTHNMLAYELPKEHVASVCAQVPLKYTNCASIGNILVYTHNMNMGTSNKIEILYPCLSVVSIPFSSLSNSLRQGSLREGRDKMNLPWLLILNCARHYFCAMCTPCINLST